MLAIATQITSGISALVAEHLPAPKADSDAPARKTNENVLVYFDMEKQSFRSFVKSSFVGAY